MASSAIDEKHEGGATLPQPATASSPTSPTKKKGFFASKKKDAAENEKQHRDSDSTDSHADATALAAAASPEPQIVPVGFTELFRYSTKFELFLDAIGLVCAAASGAAQPLMSLLFGNLTTSFVNFAIAIQRVGPGAEDALRAAQDDFRHTAALDAVWLVCLGIGMFLVTYAYMWIWTYTGEVNSKRIRERYLRAVLRQDIAFFDTLGAGEVATRIQTDTHLIQQGISEKVALIVSFIAAFATGFILAYIKSWRLALALSSILPCIVITGGVMQKFEGKYRTLALNSIAEGGTLAEEVISTVRTAQAFGTQKILSNLYDVHVAEAHSAERKVAIIHGFGLGIFFFVIYASYALAFYFGTTLILQGHANAGTIVNVFLAILIGAFSLALMAPEAQAVANARAAAAKLFATIDRVPPIDAADEGGIRPEKIVGEIRLENVKFHYPSRPNVPILKGLNVTFQAGKTAALVGASGSGKSTVVSLVERFYDPIEGSVYLDGVNIKNLNLKWLRQQIGLVQQEPSLFATTIKGNVAHGLIGSRFENLPEDEQFNLIKDACVKANAHSFIEKLPLGYDTMVGERGFLLSGGQKQRIAIARAIVSDPRILLLDEATSALDTQSEGIVQDALDKAAAGRTTITIAHRLSTIRDADQIYVVGAGEIIEHGTHNELLANENGAYSQLVSAQKLKGRDPASRDSEEQETTAEGSEAGGTGLMTKAEIEEALHDEKPLARTNTGSGRSLASEIIEKKKKEGWGQFGDKEYSLPYLFKRMGAINREDSTLYIGGAVAAIASGMVYPAFGIVFGKAISAFSLQDRHELRHAGDRNALWLFLIAICSTFAIANQNFFFSRAAAGLTSKLRSMSFRAILRQDIGWFDEDKNSTGGLVSVLSDNPTKISGLAGVTLGAIVQSIATVIGGSIIGLVFGPKLAAVGIACIPFVISAGYIRLRVVVLKDQTNKVAHEDSAQMACEAAGAVRTVQSLTRENQAFMEYSQSLEGPLVQSNRTATFSTGLFALSQSLSFFVIALVFWYGSRLVASLEYGTFEFFVCLMSVTFGSIQAGNVFSFVPDISAAKGAANDICNLLDQVPEIDAESHDGVKVDDKTIQGHIRFEDVHFRYPTRPGVRVLRNLNLVVEPGTYVALVGASGCGKSTTIQLIERFYDPLAGHVLLDGIDISTLNVNDYRKNIALVSQEPTLYAGTIRFNILLGATKPASEVTQEEIEQACRDANILEFIQSLPSGFDTEVGGKGSQLSGGQKQRIAIARALLRNPKVLLLDEATSALDSQSEKVVQAALDNAAKGRTTIAIAHRLSTIQNADRIYFFKDGRVAEAGTHDELLAKRGGYYELVQLQALSKI
ncbi:GTPase-activating protein [Tulasnella sp. 424]|nr:GTPase-activating protein [Tulasnella sp. 424]KAG8980476.1 GTPase-activating protein [Tulasnella sp. 425]